MYTRILILLILLAPYSSRLLAEEFVSDLFVADRFIITHRDSSGLLSKTYPQDQSEQAQGTIERSLRCFPTITSRIQKSTQQRYKFWDILGIGEAQTTYTFTLAYESGIHCFSDDLTVTVTTSSVNRALSELLVNKVGLEFALGQKAVSLSSSYSNHQFFDLKLNTGDPRFETRVVVPAYALFKYFKQIPTGGIILFPSKIYAPTTLTRWEIKKFNGGVDFAGIGEAQLKSESEEKSSWSQRLVLREISNIEALQRLLIHLPEEQYLPAMFVPLAPAENQTRKVSTAGNLSPHELTVEYQGTKFKLNPDYADYLKSEQVTLDCQALGGCSNIQLGLTDIELKQIASLRKSEAAEIAKQNGDLDQATKLLQDSLRLFPNNHSARESLASIFYGLLNRPEDSLPHFLLLARDRNLPKDHFQLAKVQFELGQNANALQSIQRALQGDPGNGYAHYLAGQILLSLGKREASQTSFEKAIQLQPDYPNSHYELAMILKARGDTENATKHFSIACDHFLLAACGAND